MTSTPVRGVNPLVNYVSSGKPGKAEELFADNFSAAFQRASGQSSLKERPAESEPVRSGTVQKEKGVTADMQSGEPKETISSVKQNEQTDSTGNSKKIYDAVQKAGEKLTEEVADELGISVEEVEKAMEALGLTAVDLLIPNNMTQLVLNLEGADMLALVTDGTLYQSVQNLLGEVNSSVSGLAEMFDVSPEEMFAQISRAAEFNKGTASEIVQQPEVGTVTEGSAAGTIPVQEEMPDSRNAEMKNQGSNQDIQQDALAEDGQKTYAVTVEAEEDAAAAYDNNGEKTEAEVQTAGKTVNPEQTEEAPETSGKENNNEKGKSSQEQQTQNSNLLENLLTGKNSSIKQEAVFENVMAAGKTADTGKIMNQILDYMKIQVKTDLTQMEIQLHPASLGTVNINITSKEGVITAQFMTQNESVKAAIESQIVQLKTNFEEQGIKIEAVEVTVASHQFERNLSGEGQRREQQGSGKKREARKINLNELNAGDTVMNEAEQIAVEMMTADGNTVDYTV